MSTGQRIAMRALLLGVAGAWLVVAIILLANGNTGWWLTLAIVLSFLSMCGEQIVAGRNKRFFHPVVGLEWQMWVVGAGVDFSEEPVVLAVAIGPLQFGMGFGIRGDD